MVPFFSLGQSHHAVQMPEFADGLTFTPRDVLHQHFVLFERLDADRAHILLYAHFLTLSVSASGRAGRSCASFPCCRFAFQRCHHDDTEFWEVIESAYFDHAPNVRFS